MSRSSRKHSQKTNRKLKATSLMAMCVTCGLFLGFALGAITNNVLMLTALGLVLSVAVGYYIDYKNGIAYTRRKR